MDNGHICGDLTNGLTQSGTYSLASLSKPISKAAKLTFQQESCANLHVGMQDSQTNRPQIEKKLVFLKVDIATLCDFTIDLP